MLDLTDQSGVSNLKQVDRRLPSATDYLLGIKRASNTVAGEYARRGITIWLYMPACQVITLSMRRRCDLVVCLARLTKVDE